MAATTPRPFDLRVFISSTVADLEKYRQAAFEAIQSLGAHGDDMIQWSADERSGAQQSADRVRQSDVVVLLLAHRYGFVDPASGLSITELEYRAARDAGIPVLAYFVDESHPWPPDQVEWARADALQAFRRRVEGEVTRKLFRSTDELGRLVTQALALFMERHRDRLAGRPRFQGDALRVDASVALRIQPDTAVRLGEAEDGLPLVLQVKRSRDLSRHMDALAAEMPRASDSVTALLSSFRQTLEAHARDAWAVTGLEWVSRGDGSTRQLYVTRANLSELFRATLASLLGAAGERRAPPRTSHRMASVIRSDTVIRHARPAPALESEGGRNRFLGIDPQTGEVFSVGLRDGGWVQWRPFVFESIAASLPAATFRIGGQTNARQSLAELPEALMAGAVRGALPQGRLDASVTIAVARQEIALLLAEVARRVAELHARGIVHGDLKPHNILLGRQGPEPIDAFDVAAGEASPGWTPHWSAPEQILGEPVGPACDLYPIGKMLVDVLGGELVGEVRKFKARPVDGDLAEFDIFYNPSVHVSAQAAAASGRSLASWVALARECLRFAPAERPASALELAQRIRDLAAACPLGGEVELLLPGELQVVTLPDGSQAVARVVDDRARPEIA